MRLPLTKYFSEQQKLLAAARCHFLVASDSTGGHLPVYSVGRLTDFIGGFWVAFGRITTITGHLGLPSRGVALRAALDTLVLPYGRKKLL